jgi:hypothetical protein
MRSGETREIWKPRDIERRLMVLEQRAAARLPLFPLPVDEFPELRSPESMRRLRMRVIELLISPRGEVRIETRGYVGGACLQATEALERALGLKQSDQPTAEGFQAEAATQELTREQS